MARCVKHTQSRPNVLSIFNRHDISAGLKASPKPKGSRHAHNFFGKGKRSLGQRAAAVPKRCPLMSMYVDQTIEFLLKTGSISHMIGMDVG